MELLKMLDVGDVDIITEKIKYRQEVYNEDIRMSIGVVLMNYGDSYVNVSCTKGEWNGLKKDLPHRELNDVPRCPNGHACFEMTAAPKLCLIKEE